MENSTDRILREAEVKERTRLSRVQRWRRIRAGTFPAPVQIGPNSIGWRESDINNWIRNLPAATWAAGRSTEAA